MAQPLHSADQYQSSSSASACYAGDHISGVQNVGAAYPKYTQSNLHDHQMGLSSTPQPIVYTRVVQQPQFSQSTMMSQYQLNPHSMQHAQMQIPARMPHAQQSQQQTQLPQYAAYRQYDSMQQQMNQMGRTHAQDSANCAALVQRHDLNNQAANPSMTLVLCNDDASSRPRNEPEISRNSGSFYRLENTRSFQEFTQERLEKQRGQQVQEYLQWLKQKKVPRMKSMLLRARRQKQTKGPRLEALTQKVHEDIDAILHEPVSAKSRYVSDEKAQTESVGDTLLALVKDSPCVDSADEVVEFFLFKYPHEQLRQIVNSLWQRKCALRTWQRFKLREMVDSRNYVLDKSDKCRTVNSIVNFVLDRFTNLNTRQYLIKTPAVLFAVADEWMKDFQSLN